MDGLVRKCLIVNSFGVQNRSLASVYDNHLLANSGSLKVGLTALEPYARVIRPAGVEASVGAFCIVPPDDAGAIATAG